MSEIKIIPWALGVLHRAARRRYKEPGAAAQDFETVKAVAGAGAQAATNLAKDTAGDVAEKAKVAVRLPGAFWRALMRRTAPPQG